MYQNSLRGLSNVCHNVSHDKCRWIASYEDLSLIFPITELDHLAPLVIP